MTPTNLRELVERLRARKGEGECPFRDHCFCDDEGSHDALVNPDGPEAADRIEELEAGLRVFADHAAYYEGSPDNYCPTNCVADSSGVLSRLTLANFREALRLVGEGK